MFHLQLNWSCHVPKHPFKSQTFKSFLPYLWFMIEPFLGILGGSLKEHMLFSVSMRAFWGAYFRPKPYGYAPSKLPSRRSSAPRCRCAITVPWQCLFSDDAVTSPQQSTTRPCLKRTIRQVRSETNNYISRETNRHIKQSNTENDICNDYDSLFFAFPG